MVRGEMRRLGSRARVGTQPRRTRRHSRSLAGSASSVSSVSDWILALVGAVGEDAESLFPILGRVAGLQLEAVRGRRAERTRDRFESLVRQTDIAPELQVVHIVRELVALTGAASAALTLNRHGVCVASSASAASRRSRWR